jgi:RNA polymerase sigma-70 factor (sigma-E family)
MTFTKTTPSYAENAEEPADSESLATSNVLSVWCQPAGLRQAFLEEARRTGGETVSNGMGKRSDAPRAVQGMGLTHAGAGVSTGMSRRGDGRAKVAVDPKVDFEAFVAARLPALLRFGRALTGSEHAAADLVQDALERSFMRWGRIVGAPDSDPEAYVRRVMVTRNISVWRRLRRERLSDEVPERPVTDPEAAADGEVWQALGQLSTKQRAVIALRYYDNLSEREIADLLGVSAGTVKSHASRGLEKLRVALGGSGGVEDRPMGSVT